MGTYLLLGSRFLNLQVHHLSNFAAEVIRATEAEINSSIVYMEKLHTSNGRIRQGTIRGFEVAGQLKVIIFERQD